MLQGQSARAGGAAGGDEGPREARAETGPLGRCDCHVDRKPLRRNPMTEQIRSGPELHLRAIAAKLP